MNLDLSDINTPRIITCTVEGILDEEDLLELVQGHGSSPAAGASLPVEVDDPSDLKRVREKHHHVARLVAGGMPQRMVASLTGYTESYISILLNNPAMQELLEFYRIRNGQAQELVTEKLRTVGLKALERLDEKLDTDGLDANALLGVAKLGLDRAGHGPTQKSIAVTETHIVDHAELARLNNEARKGSSGYIVDVAEVRKAALPAPEKGDDDEAA